MAADWGHGGGFGVDFDEWVWSERADLVRTAENLSWDDEFFKGYERHYYRDEVIEEEVVSSRAAIVAGRMSKKAPSD